MKTKLATCAIIVIALFAVYYVLIVKPRSLMRRHPTILQNLRMLEYAKAQWMKENKGTNQWPGRRELNCYLGGERKAFGEVIQPVHEEIYIINKIGFPVYAYFPNAWNEFSEGQLTSIQDIEDTKE